MASIYFEKYVLPILDSTVELNVLLRSGSYTEFSQIFETLFLMKRDKELEKLKNFVIGSFSEDQMSSFLDELKTKKFIEFGNDNECKPIKEFFMQRLSLLLYKVNDQSVSWAMDLTVQGHPEVEIFLRSEEQQMVYRGSGMPSGYFQKKANADNFVTRFSNLESSIEMTVVRNPRENPFVLITKRFRQAASIPAWRMSQYHSEIKYLRSFMKL